MRPILYMVGFLCLIGVLASFGLLDDRPNTEEVAMTMARTTSAIIFALVGTIAGLGLFVDSSKRLPRLKGVRIRFVR
jgi:hypothetical protein